MKPLKATFEGLPLTWCSNGLLHHRICCSRNTTAPMSYWSFSLPILLAFQPLYKLYTQILTNRLHLSSYYISCIYNWHAKVICCTGDKCIDIFQKLKLPDIFCSVLTSSTLHIHHDTTSIFLLGTGRGHSSPPIKNEFKKWPPQKASLNYIDCSTFIPVFVFAISSFIQQLLSLLCPGEGAGQRKTKNKYVNRLLKWCL